MNRSRLLLLALTCFAFFNCKSKKVQLAEGERNFPVVDFLNSQAAEIDTSMYSIMKIVTVDTLKSDTTYLKREQFRDAAADFLLLPDISSDEYIGRYKEDKRFDETLNRAWLVYLPVKPENEKIQREEVLISRDGSTVTNVIINTINNSKDSTIEKKMLWTMNSGFQVVTTRQLPGQPETITTLRVLWNGEDSQ